ncbi:hypothetical protein C7S15_0219 [Burkholderia cepacia]|nr:hypothetical protein [Burkholderia cepacia]
MYINDPSSYHASHGGGGLNPAAEIERTRSTSFVSNLICFPE